MWAHQGPQQHLTLLLAPACSAVKKDVWAMALICSWIDC
jgi:hypothetical protein